MASNLALTLEPRQCQVCRTRIGLKPCNWCKIVYYCCPEHRARDRDGHKYSCNYVNDVVDALYREAYKLRYGEDGHAFPPLRFFEDDVGRFWQVPETRDYMHERLKLVKATLNHSKNIVAVETSIDHLTDMLRLCRQDNLGARDILPILYLRLGRDQECYDFIKWWATTAHSYNWNNLNQPYLDVRDADALECPFLGLSIHLRINISHAVCVVLIKVRMLLDLQHMQNTARAFNGVLPRELIDMIRGQALVSSVLASRRDIIQASVEMTAELVELVKSQIKMLFDAVSRHNRGFWPGLVRYGGPATAFQGIMLTDDLWVFIFNYDAWKETPGAIAAIKNLMKAE